MKKILLAGNAIAANILYGYLAKDSRYQVMGLTVEDDFVGTGGIEGIETIPISRICDLYKPQDHEVIMAIGYHSLNRVRETLFNRLKSFGYKMESYVHKDAKVYTHHPLGEGCVILPNAVIEPHARVGANSMIWTQVILAHHSSVAENCWLASGAVIAGHVQIKSNTFIGVNATVVDEVVVGENCIIGAGALITKNTKAGSVHLARSAEELRYSSEDYIKYFGV